MKRVCSGLARMQSKTAFLATALALTLAGAAHAQTETPSTTEVDYNGLVTDVVSEVIKAINTTQGKISLMIGIAIALAFVVKWVRRAIRA